MFFLVIGRFLRKKVAILGIAFFTTPYFTPYRIYLPLISLKNRSILDCDSWRIFWDTSA